MIELYDICAIGNAIVDVISPADEAFLSKENLHKGAMTLIDEARAHELTARMAKGMETSGGSAANTIAGVASLGGRGAFIGKVADDRLGGVFADDLAKSSILFSNGGPLVGGPSTARCLINVTSDAQRTMATYLGAGGMLTADDILPQVIEASKIVYLEGYLFDPENARLAFAKAAGLARASGRKIALTLSDAFVVERHRDALMGFIEGQVDILFANEVEICALFQSEFDAAISGVRQLTGIAAVTRSEQGSVIVSGDDTHAVPAAPVGAVIDTTGAGDQYAAGFCFGLAAGKALPICGRLGSLAAAEVISHYGPRPQTSLSALAAKEGL